MKGVFRAGDTVCYATRGICRICSVEKHPATQEDCYLLTPVSGESSFFIYVPVRSEATVRAMRAVLSREEIDRMIKKASCEEMSWIDNDKERLNAFRAILLSGDRSALMRMIRLLYLHQQQLKKQNKKLFEKA